MHHSFIHSFIQQIASPCSQCCRHPEEVVVAPALQKFTHWFSCGGNCPQICCSASGHIVKHTAGQVTLDARSRHSPGHLPTGKRKGRATIDRPSRALLVPKATEVVSHTHTVPLAQCPWAWGGGLLLCHSLPCQLLLPPPHSSPAAAASKVLGPNCLGSVLTLPGGSTVSPPGAEKPQSWPLGHSVHLCPGLGIFHKVRAATAPGLCHRHRWEYTPHSPSRCLGPPSASTTPQLMPGLTVPTFARQSHQVTRPPNSLAAWGSASAQDPKTEAFSLPHQQAEWLFHKLPLVPGPPVFLKTGVLLRLIRMLVHIMVRSIFKKKTLQC